MSENARREGGFTLIEVVVAALILMISMLAVFTLIDASGRNTYRAEQSQVVINRAQAEMERIRQLTFTQVALTSAPTTSSTETDPRWRVSGSQYAIRRDGTQLRPMVTNGSSLQGGGTVSGGTLSPAPTAFTAGDVKGTIHRYVVWMNDTKCPESLCPGSQDLKRVIVSATLDNTAAGGQRTYQELQSDLVDPNATPVTNPVPPGSGDTGTFMTLWLTDTPCNHNSRQSLTGNHITHNTLGLCADGLSLDNDPGAPDLMDTDQPPLDPNYPADEQPIYDYSTDVEPLEGEEADAGLQERFGSVAGCNYSPGSGDVPASEKVHRWVSPRVPEGKQLTLDGDATLSLWSRTINGADHSGRLCVWLFIRRTNVGGEEVDQLLEDLDSGAGNLYFTEDDENWPANPWTEVDIDMRFPPTTVDSTSVLNAGDRLGVAVGVERGGTRPGDGLQMIYDHPSFDSRLAVETSSTLPVFP